MTRRLLHVLLILSALAVLSGCQTTAVEQTDRGVYGLIAERQREALGTTTDVRLGEEDGESSTTEAMYDSTPSPLEADLPESFQAARESDPDSDESGDSPDVEPAGENEETDSASIFSPEEKSRVRVLGLRDALAYAIRHGRQLQDSKEDLYLAALDLTLERHLWTPQLVASIDADAEFSDAGDLHDYSRAITAVAQVSATQRLPYGGEVTARVISTLVRDLEEHVTSAETGQVILEAQIPLLRGAGRSAYESRYSAEREMIYAIRTYERSRRSFMVDVAAEYFNLQQTRAGITNAFKSFESRRRDWQKADFINKMGRSDNVFEALRARASFRDAESALISAKEQYESALDQFKIFIGMPVDELVDVVDQEEDEDAQGLDRLLPAVDSAEATEVALRYRLDLLNVLDRVDDSRRAVALAKNQLMPDLGVTAGATFGTDPDRLDTLSYNPERATYNAAISLRMDDRKAERNAYRAAFIGLRRAERDSEEVADRVRADVRSALRRISQQAILREINRLGVQENELRYAAASTQYDLGKSTNQDVVDADESLLRARNRLSGAVAGYRAAILEFRLDTGTLQVEDDGSWTEGKRGRESFRSTHPPRTDITDQHENRGE